MRSLWFRFLDWVSRLLGRRSIPREPVSIRPIGVVRNSVVTPRADGWAHVRSDIIVREELAHALDGLEEYSHIIVVFAFDKVPESALRDRVRLRNDARAVISGDRISQRAAADDAEIAVGTFNAWIAGTYAGDNVKVAIAVAKWLDARKARNRIKAIVPTPPAFLQTKTASRIVDVLEYAQTLHDMGLIMRLCHRLYVLASGRTIAEGDAAHVRTHPAVIEAYLGKGATHASRA